MSRTAAALLVSTLLAACAPAATFPPPVTPVPAGTDTAFATTELRYDRATLPADWHLGPLGIDLRRAERELLGGRQPARTVVVAVIDGGVDTLHADLREHLWRNSDEVAGNGRDDDANGYVDDTWGWNFIGGPDGRSVNEDTYEVTRLYAACRGSGAAAADTVPPALRTQCPAIVQDFERRRREAEQNLTQVRAIEATMSGALPLLRRAAGTDSLTPALVAALRPADAPTRQAQQLYLQLDQQGLTEAVIAEAKEYYANGVEYGLNPDFDPRPIVGDPADPAIRSYGNRDVTGPDALHGTHVAGIIGAARDGKGVDGIATAVRIMAVRAVPNGDERDKDVANAIRYAADNGAQVINMSFGKGYSPRKPLVDAAAAYATGKGVLIVHAAGNEGADVTTTPNFPTPVADGGARLDPWIEVGATSWVGADSLVATFSNYSQTLVDVFAPGVDILSTVPGGGYERESGTSMAAPVVSGVAALLMSYFPSLTAADVKRIILETATRKEIDVLLPGGGRRVPFASLSTTGAVVNVYEAVRRAAEVAAGRP